MIDAVHETSDVFIEEIGWPYWELHNRRGLGLPLVSMDFDFQGKVMGGDKVEITLEANLGSSSVDFDYRATHKGETVFEGIEHRVCVPVDADQSVPVPEALRNALEKNDPDAR